MSNDDFVSYVGNPDFHDGAVLRVIAGQDMARIVVRGASGQEYAVEFHGVKAVRANRAEGMMLYALAETKAGASVRRFVFSNWEHDDDASLEIDAEGFSITSLK